MSCSSDSSKEKKSNSVKPADFVGVEILSENATKYISEDAFIEVIDSGFTWSEGPLWIDSLQGLIFSDVPHNKIYLWKEGEKSIEYLNPSGYTDTIPRQGEPGSNGLTLDNNGNLLLCQHGDRRIARMTSSLANPSSNFQTVAGAYNNKKFNSPNDLCVSSNGNIYFTDPPYGLAENAVKELDFNGVFFTTPDNDLQLVTDTLTRPNGIALSPDETKLYVANSDPEKAIWVEYKIDKDKDQIVSGKTFFDATKYVDLHKGLPDGLKVNSQGILFATGPGGIWVFDPSGEVLARIFTGQATANCSFGENENTLFITADDYLMKMELKSSQMH